MPKRQLKRPQRAFRYKPEQQHMPTSQVKRAYELLGRIVAEWNDVESLWELIFTCVLHEAPRPKIDVILQQFQSSAAQQRMIKAVCDLAFEKDSYEHKEAERLYDETSEVRKLRNAVAHAWYVFDPLNSKIGLRIAPGSRAKPNRLASEQLGDALPEVLARTEQLGRKLNEFRLHLAGSWLPPEKRSRRPSLPPEANEALTRTLPDLIANIRRQKGWPPMC
jgi:hypothetical protein